MCKWLSTCLVLTAMLLVVGCGGASNDLSIPNLGILNGETSAVGNQFASLGEGIPDGRTLTFVGDVVTLRGIFFEDGLKVYLGRNNALAYREGSLMKAPRHVLPDGPFVYTDPNTGRQTVLEVEATVTRNTDSEVEIRIPASVACSPDFTNPIIRFVGRDGSSVPVTNVYHVVGPIAVAMTPNRGPDIGGASVTVHGFFFSPYTQIGFQFINPDNPNETIVRGLSTNDDINEVFIDSNTLVIEDWPGIVRDVTHGLTEELKVRLLVKENVDAIAARADLEPFLVLFGSVSPCALLEPNGPSAPVESNGVRNFEKDNAFTFLPSGVTDPPVLEGITPESGTEMGGNIVILHGQQLDAFTADTELIEPEENIEPRFGIQVECPPGSGEFIDPIAAVLVDRETLVVTMPSCEVEVPEKVDIRLRNKFTMERFGGGGQLWETFDDVYEYTPIPPILPPQIFSIFPAEAETEQPHGQARDHGLERLMVVGDWFDPDTALNGGFEFLLRNGDEEIVVQTQRTIFHSRNLIEVYTKRLPASFYPLSAPELAGIRVRNVIGFTDFPDSFTFYPVPEVDDYPEIDEISPASGSITGGNEVMLIGENFDTRTVVHFGDTTIESDDVTYINEGLLIVRAPSVGFPGTVSVIAENSYETSSAQSYQYTAGFEESRPAIAFLDPNEGSATGGYDILAYGINLGPLTRFEFGADDGNFSQETFPISGNLVMVEVPEAYPSQIGATVNVGATDPLMGTDEAVRTVEFTYLAAPKPPEIHFVSTTVVDPATPTALPALNIGGGDRMLVVGAWFDQKTTFDITKPQTGTDTTSVPTREVVVLTPNLAVMISPASPDGLPGPADLRAENSVGESEPFPVEYVEPGPPTIIDVRNLDTGTQDSPIDAQDRLIIFGDNFFKPVTVELTGGKLGGEADEMVTVKLEDAQVTVVDDHLIGVNIPKDTFRKGGLEIKVSTPYAPAATFSDTTNEGAFQLIGPQPPIVIGIFPSRFNSLGGEEAVLFGRYFTDSTRFEFRTDLSDAGAFRPPFSQEVISNTVAIVTMSDLPGGPPSSPTLGDVRAFIDPQLDSSNLITKLGGPQNSFRISEEIFAVVLDEMPVLLGIVPDHGSIDGGEQVLLIGSNFLDALGQSNLQDIVISDETLGAIGDYAEADITELPLDSLNASNWGKYVILNDHEILLLTNPRGSAIAPEDEVAPADITIMSDKGNFTVEGGYSYQNTPAVRTPFLLGITPNETRLNGGTTHLLSGYFLTDVGRIVLTKPLSDPLQELVIGSSSFQQVNDSFLVFEMPDLSSTFAAGDELTVRAEKFLDGTWIPSNDLLMALKVTFAGPPVLNTLSASDSTGSAFGGETLTLSGALFTPNSQVLFGTIPARQVVYVNPTQLLVITPSLPIDAPHPGIDLLNIDDAPSNSALDENIDLAVFTQGGWAVLENAYTFQTEAPGIDPSAGYDVAEGGTIRVVIEGSNFIPSAGATTVNSTQGGTITGLRVESFERLSFDYTADTWAAATAGPLTDELTVQTDHGTSSQTLDITIQLTPFVTGVSSSFDTGDPTSDPTAPSTGTDNGAFVEITLEGGNFVDLGSELSVTLRTGDTLNLTRIGSGDAFSGLGQFRVDAPNDEIVFTAPYAFAKNVPTLVDGNPNIGPVDIAYQTALGLEMMEDDAFLYVPSLIDFEDYSFTIPVVSPLDTIPQRITMGDINQDGVMDLVAIARQDDWNGNDVEDPDAFVYIANTFGDGVDVNGDGLTPDFAGTFTKTVIENDDVKTYLYRDGRGGKVRIADLDDDDELELIIPAQTQSGTDQARLLLVDVDSDMDFATQTVIDPGSVTSSFCIGGIATGDFDDGHDGIDIAVLIGGTESERQIVIFASDGDNYDDFTDSATDIDDPWDDFRTGFLEAGDFDDDGDDDLIWGHSAKYESVAAQAKFPVVVAEIDNTQATAANKVVSQKKLTNFTGGSVKKIEVYDIDGNGNDDAVIIAWDGATGALLDNVQTPAVVAIVLDPLDLEADDFFQTGFLRQSGTLGDGGSNHMAHADFNGDGIADLVVLGNDREFSVFFGNRAPDPLPADFHWFRESGRSWSLVTAPGDPVWAQVVDGAAAADMNHDGLAEIFVSDAGASPKSIILWLNQSR